jgi:hypothetical protein
VTVVRESEKIVRVPVPGPARVEVVEKIRFLKLWPDAVSPITASDCNSRILASGTVPPWPGATRVTAVGSVAPEDNTLRVRIESKQEAPKFFEIKRDFRVAARFLPIGRNQVEAEVVANPLRVGPVEIEAGIGVDVARDDATIGARGWIGGQLRF